MELHRGSRMRTKLKMLIGYGDRIGAGFKMDALLDEIEEYVNELKDKQDKTMYYILIKPWAVYVKDGQFFIDQGGLKNDWGKNWVPVWANSFDEARQIGINMRENSENA